MKMNLNLGFKMKKLFGKNNVMPLVLVAFLIVMLSMCYRNQNRISAVGGSLFEGFKEGENDDDDDGDGDTFKGGFQEGGCGDDPDDPTAGCFTGHRQGFRGRRQGFRGRREGMTAGASSEVPVVPSHSHGGMNPEAPLPDPTHKLDEIGTGAHVNDSDKEKKEAFRGRREGFRRRKRSPRKKLGFFGLKRSGSKKTGFRGRRASRGKQGFVGARFQPNTAGSFGSTAATF